jgi:methyltransferase (TIGR00027 family)
MDGGQASRTAEGAAMLRAAHLLVDDPPPIFEDHLALRFLEERFAAMAHDPVAMGAPTLMASRASVTGRSRVAEPLVEEAVAAGVRQHVILGAGYDSFAWRRPELVEALDVYEVDHPATQARKRAITAELAPGAAPVRFVPIDFERDRLEEALPAAGWVPGEPTFFTWQGVTMYLTDAATFATLGFVAAAAPGSTIVFQFHVAEDLLPEHVLAVRRSAVAGMARGDEPWINTYRPAELAERVAALGFSDVATLGASDLNPRLFAGRTDGLRWPESSALCVATI